MKKLVCILILMLGALSVSAQTDATKTVADEEYPVYCDLEHFNGFPYTNLVRLDLGHSKFETIYDENGEKKKFNSAIDAVNYMAKRGWKVQTNYYLKEESSEETHYLLYKMVKDDKEIYEGLKTEK